MSLEDILRSPGFWGFAGAFIWAGPEWLACAFSGKGPPLRCSLELAIRLITGALAGAAFAPWLIEAFHINIVRIEPVAALVGLTANSTAPKLVDILSRRAAAIFKGEAKSDP